LAVEHQEGTECSSVPCNASDVGYFVTLQFIFYRHWILILMFLFFAKLKPNAYIISPVTGYRIMGIGYRILVVKSEEVVLLHKWKFENGSVRTKIVEEEIFLPFS
jgi:hypothetical protein